MESILHLAACSLALWSSSFLSNFILSWCSSWASFRSVACTSGQQQSEGRLSPHPKRPEVPAVPLSIFGFFGCGIRSPAIVSSLDTTEEWGNVFTWKTVWEQTWESFMTGWGIWLPPFELDCGFNRAGNDWKLAAVDAAWDSECCNVTAGWVWIRLWAFPLFNGDLDDKHDCDELVAVMGGSEVKEEGWEQELEKTDTGKCSVFGSSSSRMSPEELMSSSCGSFFISISFFSPSFKETCITWKGKYTVNSGSRNVKLNFGIRQDFWRLFKNIISMKNSDAVHINIWRRKWTMKWYELYLNNKMMCQWCTSELYLQSVKENHTIKSSYRIINTFHIDC